MQVSFANRRALDRNFVTLGILLVCTWCIDCMSDVKCWSSFDQLLLSPIGNQYTNFNVNFESMCLMYLHTDVESLKPKIGSLFQILIATCVNFRLEIDFRFHLFFQT